MPDFAGRIAENLGRVRARMAAAAARAGRDPATVRLLTVTKYVGPEAIRAVVEAGCRDLGESRPQQLWDRAATLGGLSIRWHMIGHLQRNKVRRTVPLVDMIHSVDSPRLIAELDDAAGQCGRRLPILLEVNISGEAAKDGLAAAAVEPLLPQLAGYGHLEVRGLMCMAGLEGDLDAARREFAALRSLRDQLAKNCPAGVLLAELSMGMSGDFEAAIEEGATIVRVGSALFEGLPPESPLPPGEG
ncbi:MAG: YggS family pyridoxal phosphate-dependent enzyme [Thermoguttaceae bacterium]